MAERALLITNNPEFQDSQPAHADLQFVDGAALDVLTTARNLAHKGWILANHPLYGNFRPHQQPYRSLLMLPPNSQPVAGAQEPITPLQVLEDALMLYQSPIRKSRPGDVPEHMRKDCALIDRELLRATLDTLA